VAPTVIAEGTYAGEYLQASGRLVLPELPAATTTVTPAATALSMATFTVDTMPRPPRLALKTAGFCPLPVFITHSNASTNHENEPLPESLRTFTACRYDDFATP